MDQTEVEKMIFEEVKNLPSKLAYCKKLIEDLQRQLNIYPPFLKGLVIAFTNYLNHFSNPSSFLIQYLIQMKLKKQAVAYVEKIKNSCGKI